MLEHILTSFSHHPSLSALLSSLKTGRCAVIHGLGGSSSAFLASALLDDVSIRGKGSIIAVLPAEEEALAFHDDVEGVLGADRVLFFPERDTAPYEPVDSHFEVRSRRVETLDSIERGWKGLVVATVGALHDPSTPPGLINLVSLDVRKGGKVSFDEFVRSLTGRGFKRQNAVSAAGQIAVRGGIVDVFPFGGEIPYRIEFWGDEIESVRSFSTSSQRSLEHVDAVRIIPPNECITEAGIDPEDDRRMRDIENEAGISLARLRKAFSGGDRPNGAEQYLHVVFGPKASLLSYFNDTDIVIVFDPGRCVHALEQRVMKAEDARERLRHEDPDLPPPGHLYEAPDRLMERMRRFTLVENHDIRPHGHANVIEFSVAPSRQYQGSIEEVRKDIRSAADDGGSSFIACDNKGQVDRLNELLEETEGLYSIGTTRLSGGFVSRETGICLFTDHEIFSRYRRRVRYRRFKDGVPVPDWRSLTLGDYVVHVDHGIGRYMGLRRIKTGDVENDCLLIQYKGADQLFVPVDQLKRIKRYTSEEGVVPVVTRLGGTAWETLKARTKKSIRRMAEDLLRLYAERKSLPGHAFQPDEAMLRALEESFVYDETPDQHKSWSEVLSDMMSTSPMERLLCGDVGFGKTEVALRAAYVAVLDNRQAAVLVPTTILADQHEDTFRERLADFPVRVEAISRFRSKSEQKAILERLAAGTIDIVIGTHRLLSKDVHFRNLGLLVVDEEQRFGVRHKERIKTLRRNVDVLSMSATPIPRTLNMSLSGARDISFINTPPRDRYSVHTEIMPFEEKNIIEAIMREIDREGQVYFVHNRVQSIQSMAAYLKGLLPSVTFGVAHGQMKENELETIMRDFHHNRFQVLVTTMIIENGLDIPSVNTIIINRADTFGLSQLYQLRGRVGRSNRRAYAYLLVPPRMTLTPIARQRLRIIEEFADLGSGFKIAMRDLEIRGAGNILGTEQSGFISVVGFDMYTELLHETIAELRGETIQKPPEVDVNIKTDSFFPDTYIPDAGERVLFYRKLSETITADEVSAIADEITDRFGRPSGPAANIIDTAYIRHYASAAGISEVMFAGTEAFLHIPETVDVTRDVVEKMVAKSPVKLTFSFNKGMRVSFPVKTDEMRPLEKIKKVLQAVVA